MPHLRASTGMPCRQIRDGRLRLPCTRRRSWCQERSKSARSALSRRHLTRQPAPCCRRLKENVPPPFAPVYTQNASFCQDRLGTNIGKALKKDPRNDRTSCTDSGGCTFQAWGLTTKPAKPPSGEVLAGKKTHMFLRRFILKMHRFTKTGSGQA